MGLRTNTAVWLSNQNRWQIKVQKDGVRRTFTSTKPGRTGQREANRKADAWLDEGISSTTKRCADVWAEYMIAVKATGGTSNIEQVEKFGRNYILPVIGQRRIGDLTVPKGARLKGRKILQPDSLRVLLSTDTRVVRGKVEPDENVHAYRIAVMTGLRPGELLGLRVGDLDGDRVHIGRAINRQQEVTSGKNENAIRTVVLHPLAVAEIRAQLQQRTQEEERPLRDDDPLFLLSNQQSLYNYWKFYQRCNGIDPPVSLYELRHTFVSMIEDAVPPAQLRRIVGHSKSMDTYGWYSHAVTGRDDATAQAVSGVLSEYAPGPEK